MSNQVSDKNTNDKSIIDSIPESMRGYLDTPIGDIHLAQLADVMEEWEGLAPYLGLTRAEQKEIIENYRGRFNLQKREALGKWKQKNGSNATYRKLIIIFCLQNEVILAEKIKEFLLASSTSDSSNASSIIDVFQNYLRDCYSSVPHPSSLQWPISSNDLFVELKLVDAPVLSDYDNSTDVAKHHKVETIPLKFLINAGNSKAKRKVVLVEGVAGAGKTTLSWHACKEWAEGKLLEDIKLLIHVSLGDPEIHSASKLADLIPHPSEEMRENVIKAISNKRGKGVCFLLEGYDEGPQSLWKSFLYRFIAGTGGRSMLPGAHIIITSRPGFPVLQLFKCLTGKVVVSGFHSLDYFINTCSIENSEKLLEAVKMKPELYSHCHLPLNAVILVYLYDVLKDNLPTTRTGLFDPLVRHFLIRHMQSRAKYDIQNIDNFPEDLPDDIRSLLRKVSELAYTTLFQGKNFDPKMLSKSGIDCTFGFLRVHTRLTMYGLAKTFSFIHLSL